MATTTLAPSAAERHVGTGGVNIFGRQQSLRADFLALVALLVAALGALGVGYTRPADFTLGVDGRYNLPYLQGFHEPESAAGSAAPSYRWTRERSTVLAPGLGRGLWQTELSLGSPQPAEQPKQIVIATDAHQLPLQLQPQQR